MTTFLESIWNARACPPKVERNNFILTKSSCQNLKTFGFTQNKIRTKRPFKSEMVQIINHHRFQWPKMYHTRLVIEIEKGVKLTRSNTGIFYLIFNIASYCMHNEGFKVSLSTRSASKKDLSKSAWCCPENGPISEDVDISRLTLHELVRGGIELV